MRPIEQLELPLWERLKEAKIAPDVADLGNLFAVLEETLSDLDTVGQLQVAAEASAQIVAVFGERSSLAFEELEATNSREGPVMPSDAFDRYVRQTMAVDLEQFIEPWESLPRKSRERTVEEGESIVGELDQALLLQVLDEQMNRHPGLAEVEAFNQAIGIAHEEDVSMGVGTIAAWMAEHQVGAIPLLQLQQAIEMPLLQLWLVLLLGGYAIEQRGEFYETHQIWVFIQKRLKLPCKGKQCSVIQAAKILVMSAVSKMDVHHFANFQPPIVVARVALTKGFTIAATRMPVAPTDKGKFVRVDCAKERLTASTSVTPEIVESA